MAASDHADADAIAAALARLRGRRPNRPPWAGDPGAPEDEHAHGHGHGAGPWAHGRRGWPGWQGGPGPGPAGWGPPPWAGAARFGGPARVRLLDALATASEPLTVGALAEAIGVDQPRASRLVQQCAAAGLVRREADPDDARRTRIALTDAGAALARTFRGDRREAVAAALDGFTDAERAELARLLTKLADAWPAG